MKPKCGKFDMHDDAHNVIHKVMYIICFMNCRNKRMVMETNTVEKHDKILSNKS